MYRRVGGSLSISLFCIGLGFLVYAAAYGDSGPKEEERPDEVPVETPLPLPSGRSPNGGDGVVQLGIMISYSYAQCDSPNARVYLNARGLPRDAQLEALVAPVNEGQREGDYVSVGVPKRFSVSAVELPEQPAEGAGATNEVVVEFGRTGIVGSAEAIQVLLVGDGIQSNTVILHNDEFLC